LPSTYLHCDIRLSRLNRGIPSIAFHSALPLPGEIHGAALFVRINQQHIPS
jgi:hypothetical protein